MKKYTKALIFFPFLIQIFGTCILILAEETSETLTTADSVIFSALSAFIVATLPALLIVIWAAAYRYTRNNVKSIVFIAALIGFCYTNIAGFAYVELFEKPMTFSIWLRTGGLELTFLMSAAIALYSVLVLPFLLPKEK